MCPQDLLMFNSQMCDLLQLAEFFKLAKITLILIHTGEIWSLMFIVGGINGNQSENV